MKINLFLGASVFFLFIISLLGLAIVGGGGEAAAYPIGAVTYEDKAEEYATVASKMSAPWSIVILTDTIDAWDEELSGIEDINPIYTTLQFVILNISIDNKTSNGWEYKETKVYTAKKEILKFLGVKEKDIEDHTPETLMELAVEKCQKMSSDSKRYTASFAPNTDYEAVLTDYIKMKPDDIEKVLALNEVDYMEINLTQEAIERIRDIEASYGINQNNEYTPEVGRYASYEGVTYSDGETAVVYYNQLDPRWSEKRYGSYGSDTIGAAACGPTAMAIVVSSLTDNTLDPVAMAAWSVDNGYWVEAHGSAHELIPAAARAYGLNVTGATAADAQEILDALAEGKLVVGLMKGGTFAKYGHFIVLRGVSDGKIAVADPSSKKNSERLWDSQYVFDSGIVGANAGGPFWIIG